MKGHRKRENWFDDWLSLLVPLATGLIIKVNNKQIRIFVLLLFLSPVVVIAVIYFLVNQAVPDVNVSKLTNRTKAEIRVLHEAVQIFKLDTGRYPTQMVGLQELIDKPVDVEQWPECGYLNSTEIPKDSWGNDFVYQLYPPGTEPFVIISYGADGKPGGVGKNIDLSSTDQ